MSEWKKVKIKDIAKLDNGINFNKSAYAPGVKIIGVSDFKDRFSPDFSTLQEVKVEIVRSGDYLHPGDILFVRSNGNRDLVGRCMLIDKHILSTFSGFCIRLRILDKSSYNPYFFTYHFKTQLFRKSIAGSAIGANIQNLSQERLGNYEFKLPEYSIQCRIADILSRYDSLIENYQKQIKLLEESAQRLYKEWFVDLRFPGHENTKIVDGVPEGWEKKCLGDFCLIFTGKKNANSNIKNGKYKFFTCGDKPLSINSYIYDGAAIIISGNGSYTGRTTFFKGKFDLYQRTYACTIKSGFNNNYIYGLYEFVNSELTSQISGGTHGAAIPYIVMSDLTGFTFLYNEYVLLKFSSIIKKNLLETIKIIDRIQLLTEARDRLLPKLMSGEIEV